MAEKGVEEQVLAMERLRSKKASTAYLKTGSVSIANPEIRCRT